MSFPYRPKEKLYESANSVVYRAYDEAQARPIILKTLNLAYPSPEKIAWFRREYELSLELSATIPSVVAAYELYTEQNRWVMALEDFGGESLSRLKLAGQLPLADFFHLALQVAESLGQVHRQGVMHKDLNPANIVFNVQTRQAKLIDFGISTRLSRETPTFRHPDQLEGTPAYISPEQTGRMNRALDYRTDFYSLGATFYELLTGQVPFPAQDLLDLVHSHIARAPMPPTALRPDLPPMVEAVVLKLLSKTAEDRYQSAYGLKADLEICQRQWETARRIVTFPLGGYDFSDRLQLPQKLYGRDQEIAALLAAFERVNLGARELMLVTGAAGLGKSALVHEVYKPLTRRRGYFLTGKYDQFQRNLPYAAILEAFRGLIQQVLAESEAQLNDWREKLRAALGPNGQIIAAVLPEVELILGPQPATPDLPPLEAQNRFNFAFQNFVNAFAAPEHPLALFLDDLQWADSASLNLLQRLVTGAGHRALFLIGAYRDNEVGNEHPLAMMLSEARKGGATITTLSLAALGQADLTRLLADALAEAEDHVRPLAELVLSKTGGNPFFVGEFLKSLYAEGLLAFAPTSQGVGGGWQWDVAHIQARGITDNVVTLLASKVQQLPATAQTGLTWAACLGNQFDLGTLGRVLQISPRKIATGLWPALAEGLLLPLDDGYKLAELEVEGLTETLHVKYRFAHDRVQQAVYSLLTEPERQARHWRIGQLLLTSAPNTLREARLFDMVNHLNLGSRLIEDEKERDELAELNLQAGQRAKAAAAHAPALRYLRAGLKLLNALPLEQDPLLPMQLGSWTRRYALTHTLCEDAAEAAYLSGSLEAMETFLEAVLHHSTTVLEKNRAYEIKIQSLIVHSRYDDARRIGLAALQELGVRFPDNPSRGQVALAMIQTRIALLGKRIEDLARLPVMTDPYHLATARLLASISTVFYVSRPNLFVLNILKLINLSLRYGNSPASTAAYVAYGLLLCGVVGDIDAGYHFGRLALQLIDIVDANRDRGRALMTFEGFIRPWKEPLRETLQPFLNAYRVCLENGNMEFASHSLAGYCRNAFLIGQELSDVDQAMETYGDALRQLQQALALQRVKLYHQVVLNLRGRSTNPRHLQGEQFDAEARLPHLFAIKDFFSVFSIYVCQAFLHYLFGAYTEALECARQAEVHKGGAIAVSSVALVPFYDSLARAALALERPLTERKALLKPIAANQKRLKKWARHAPANFLHKWHLVEAELAHAQDRVGEAREHYDHAIALARENGFLSEEALAYERAAIFYLARNVPHLAAYYLREAHYAYVRWGATAKVQDLEARYSQLLVQVTSTATPVGANATANLSTTSHHGTALDVVSLVQATQALSGEIALDKLLVKLMQLVLAAAGAQSGALLLEQEGQWRIEAEGHLAPEEMTTLSGAPLAPERLPLMVFNYVIRAKESVVLANASQAQLYMRDPYIVAAQPLSVLCTPLLQQGKLVGVLYLENNLAADAFTPERVEMLRLLSTQAAISLENARLYTRLEENNRLLEKRVGERTAELARRVEQLNLINRVGRSATSQLDRVALLASLAEAIRAAFDYYAVLILLKAPDADEVRLSAAATVEKIDLLEAGLTRALGQGLIGHAAATREPLVAEDVVHHQWYRADDRLPRTRSELALPLHVGGQVLGVLDLESAALNAFRPEDVQVLQTLADQIAIALHNAALFQTAQAARAEAETANQMKSRFLANMSHELRTPLNSIINFAYLLDLEATSPDQSDLLNRISVAGQHLLGLINDILDLAKVESGRLELFPEECDLRDLIQGVLSTSVGLLKDKPVELRRELPEGALPIYADQTRVRQVLLNLLSNAAKFTDQGSITVRVQAENDAFLSVSVTDTGPGIAPADLPKVFMEFVQLESGYQKGGTGLGLPISKRFVEMHGGQMWVESQKGVGSTFFFTLPRQAELAEETKR